MYLFAQNNTRKIRLEKGTIGPDDSYHKILNQFSDVLTEGLLKTLPPQRAIDHQIPLIPGSMPPAKAPYRMNATQLAELKK